MNKNTSEFYDNKVDVYKVPFTKGSIYEKAASYIKSKSEVLDVGCGNATFSSFLKSSKKTVVVGLEISPKMASNAKKKLDKVIMGDIETLKLPFENAQFDYILLMDLLEHTFEPQKVLAKLKPHLKRNGRFIVTIPNIANWKIRKQLLEGKFNYERSGILDTGHIRFFTYDSACDLFKKSGFKKVKTDMVCDFPSIIVKIQKRLPFIKITHRLEKLFPGLFAHQYIFILKKT